MGHSRQEGGFSEAPQKPLEGFPEIPTAEALRQRPDPRADMSGPRAGLEALRPDFVPNEVFTPYRPPRPEKSEGGRPLTIVQHRLASCTRKTIPARLRRKRERKRTPAR